MMSSDESLGGCPFYESDGSDVDSDSSEVELSEEEPLAEAANRQDISTLKGVANLTLRKHKAYEVLFVKHPEEVRQAELRQERSSKKVKELRFQVDFEKEEMRMATWRHSQAKEIQAPSPFTGRQVLVPPCPEGSAWQIQGPKDWNTGLYHLKPVSENQTTQDLWLPSSSFHVLAQPYDKVSVVYTLRIPVPPAEPVPVPEAAAEAEAEAVPEQVKEPEVVKVEQKQSNGVAQGRDGAKTLVFCEDGQSRWIPDEDVTVHMAPEFRFRTGVTVGYVGQLGRLNGQVLHQGLWKVQVAFAHGTTLLPESELITEKAWWSNRLEQFKPSLEKNEKKLAEAEAEMEKAMGEIQALHASHEGKQKAYDDAGKALSKVKYSNVLKVQTLVSFKRGKARPTAWRDIANYVELSWVVSVEVPGERPAILSLEDCKGMSRSVLGGNGCPGPHIIAAAGSKLNRCPGVKPRKGGYLSLARPVAKQILKHSKKNAAGPEPMHAFALLKAAVGAQPGVLLDGPVEEFYQGPEIGLIRVKEVPPPEQLKDVLRPYQLSGYHWLVNNARNGLGCILADDMGLGKTLQAIALMLYMKQHGMLTKPMLVVVPKGLVGTWKKELKRWAGDALKVHSYVGQQRQLLPHMINEPPPKRQRLIGKQTPNAKKAPKVRVAKSSAEVFLTSYGTFRANVGKLSVPGAFGGMLLDEAQQIKNYNTQISKAVKEVAEHVGSIRVALSGTPVENRLSDLNSQFEYILPGYLASNRAEFQRTFGRPVTNSVKRDMRRRAASTDASGPPTDGQDHGLASQENLRRLIKPFLMRRLKTEPGVAEELPDKINQEQDCELTETQKRIYVAIQEECLAETLRADSFQRHGQVLKMLHALREVCNHPQLVAEKRQPPSMVSTIQSCDAGAKGSGKIERLMELLEEILEGGEKVLIFSNYLKTIDKLQDLIRNRFNKEVLKIVGEMGTEAREAVVERFQNDRNLPVLILSLKAGGVGLTLTAATHVIHFDRQYNPAVEAQATDRAHRIGQKSTVVVHRFITKDTFEEKLNQIMQEKQRLSDITVEAGESWIADCSDAQLRDLFSLGS